MAYVISDACVSCGACAAQCPVEAISEGDSQYVINADACIECGSCADGCPTEAISQQEFVWCKRKQRTSVLTAS